MFDSRFETFITLTKVKNYTRTAELLNITQPAVTQHIKHLEDYYKVKLFTKKGSTLEITEEGKILLKYAFKIKRLFILARSQLSNTNNIKKRFYIGATFTTGEYILPYILGEYKNVRPNYDVLMNVANTETVLKGLLKYKYNLCLVEGPFDRGMFNYETLTDDELVLVVSPQHPFASRDSVEISEVINGNLILREPGSGTRKVFEDKLLELGYSQKDINVFMELGSIKAIKSAVESNLGYTVISKFAVQRELELQTLKIIAFKDLTIKRKLNFVYLKENVENEFIKEFVSFCKDNMPLMI